MEEIKLKIKNKEDKEFLRTILLERSTFFTRKIVEFKTMQLRSHDEETYKICKESEEYYKKCKKVIDNFYDEIGVENV